MYEYFCTLDQSKYDMGAVDGDTVDVVVDLGFRTFRKTRVRLLLVDTPERGEAVVVLKQNRPGRE